MQSSTGDMEARKKLLSGELKGIIEHAMEQIPQNLSIVFSLRALNGLTIKETALVLEISEANVKT